MRQLRPLTSVALSFGSVIGFSLLLRLGSMSNPTTAAIGLLVIVLATATLSRLWVAIATSFVAMLCLNYFFVPPVGTFTVADAHHWVSLGAFVTVAVVASQLSSLAQARARDAIASRNELGRLFDLSRDVLLTEDGSPALDPLARHIARRFELPVVGLCLPSRDGTWEIHQGSDEEVRLPADELNGLMARAGVALEFDARHRVYGGQATVTAEGSRPLRVVPLRVGTRVVGFLAAPATFDASTADAVAGLAAIAVDRSQLLAERKETERVREKADLASTLLASMGHDLRTPLTAIAVAVENLDDEALSAIQRRDQVRLAQSELQRLNRLFRDILDMARIDASVLTMKAEWVTAADIVDAAFSNLRPELEGRDLRVEADERTAAFVDPRLTTSALSHLLENATQYSGSDRPIDVRGWVDADGLHLVVRDHGPGLDADELDHLFERFFRGRAGVGATAGSGMGLAITRGLLAAERGRVWGANAVGGGAEFTILVPAVSRAVGIEA